MQNTYSVTVYFLDLYKARMNMPILNKEYSEAMRNLSSAEARALALPLCTEVTTMKQFNQNFSKLIITKKVDFCLNSNSKLFLCIH